MSLSAFHPDFATPSDDGLVLESADGVRWFDKEILLESSSFFQDLLSLPPPLVTSEQRIPFPETNSSALEYALRLLLPRDGYDTVAWLPALPSNRAVLDEILAFAEAYELPCVLKRLLDSLILTDEPGMRFLLAVLLSQRTVSATCASILVREAEFRGGAWWSTRLREKQPAVHAKLAELFTQREAWSFGFFVCKRHEWISSLMENENENAVPFEQCLRRANRCPPYVAFHGDWALVQDFVFRQLHAHMMMPFGTPFRQAARITLQLVECQACRAQMNVMLNNSTRFGGVMAILPRSGLRGAKSSPPWSADDPLSTREPSRSTCAC